MIARKFAFALAAGFAFAVVGIAGVVGTEKTEIASNDTGCSTAFAELNTDTGNPVTSITVSCPRPLVQVAQR